VAGALATAIPKGTTLHGFSYRNGVATVDLSGQFAAPDGLAGRLRVGQVVWTVTRLIQTAQVRILVDGRPAGQIGPDGFQVTRERPWQRTMTPLAGLWPQRSAVGGADRVLFVRKGKIWSVRPEPNQQAVQLAFDAPGGIESAPTWSPNYRRVAFLLTGGNDQSVWIGEVGDRKAAPVGLVAKRLSPPSWSPDSNALYVLSRDGDRTRLNRIDLVSWSVDPVALAPLPGNLQPTLLEVSPDGAFVLAVGAGRGDQLGDGGQLFLGLLGLQGVTSWFPRPIAPGLGTVFSPVWVDALTVAFVAQTNAKDDLGKLWIMRSDGWDPTPVINLDPTSESAVDIGNQLTVDPAGSNFVFTVQSENGTSLWMVDRQGSGLRPLTTPLPNDFATDPSFASR
jgi:dipeptidyl aminopeptidase/acylaminoacyl peptidase